MIKLRQKLIFFSLSISSMVSATAYYVSNSGNDDSDGLTPATAWQTIAHVNSRSFSAGDLILFNKGDIWRESLIVTSSGSVSNYITIGSYGTGNKPSLIGSVKATNWNHHGGNVWSCGTSIADPYTGYKGNIFFEEFNGSITWGNVQKSDTASLLKEYDWVWSGNKIYIYSATDPDARYSAVEVSQEDVGLRLNDKEFIKIDGLDFKYWRLAGIKGSYPAVYVEGLIIKNCEVGYIGIKASLAAFGLSIYHSNCLVQNNVIHDCGRRSVSINVDDASPAVVRNITIENNYFYNGFHTTGVDIGNTGNNTFRNFIIRNNIFYDNPTWVVDEVEVYISNMIWASRRQGTVDSLYIYNNVFSYTNTKCIAINGVNSCFINNNTFYGNNPTTTSFAGMLYIDGSATVNYVKNNIFYGTADHNVNPAFPCIYIQTSSTVLSLDYNLYWQEDPLQVMVNVSGGKRISDWNSYRSSTGFDAHSPFPSNPLFISPPDNYHLPSNSPAVNAGVNIPGYTADFDSIAVSSPPSIGAFQGGGSSNGDLAPGSIGTLQSKCYNSVPDPLTQITPPSGGTGTYTYQWQSSPNNSVWTNINGATLSGYSPPTLLASTYFRRTVSSGSYIPVNSTSVLVTVSPQITPAQLHDDITIGNNTSTYLNISVSGGTSPFTIYYTRNGVAQPTINNYMSGTNISTGVLTTGVYNYALTSVTDAIGCSAPSLGNNITVTVIENGNLAPGSIGTAQSICYNTAPVTLTQIAAPSGGTGTYTYQWQSSLNNSTWTDISGATLSEYLPLALITNTYYRRTVTSGSFIPVYSSSILITIYPQVTSAQLHDDISIVENASTYFNVDISGGNSPFTVEYSHNGIPRSIDNYFSGDTISTDILTAGVYTYALTSVTDANGCEAQNLGTYITITVTGQILGIPNVFTPNNDGINETWAIPSIHNFPDAVIRIYDRNLIQIIQYTGLDPEWDGRDSNGNPLIAGAYLYVIELNDGTRPIKGYISLVK